MTHKEAEAILQATPGYGWLMNDGRLFWTPVDLESKLGFSANTIRKWAESGLIPGVLDFGSTGIRIPREGLMIYLAQRIVSQQQQKDVS